MPTQARGHGLRSPPGPRQLLSPWETETQVTENWVAAPNACQELCMEEMNMPVNASNTLSFWRDQIWETPFKQVGTAGKSAGVSLQLTTLGFTVAAQCHLPAQWEPLMQQPPSPSKKIFQESAVRYQNFLRFTHGLFQTLKQHNPQLKDLTA